MDEISIWFDPRHLFLHLHQRRLRRIYLSTQSQPLEGQDAFFKMSMNGTMDGWVGPWRDGLIEGEL